MQPFYEPAVGDIVIVERDDRHDDRIPHVYRQYVTYHTYLFKARVVRVNGSKPYHRVVPVPWAAWDTDAGSRHSHKAHRTKLFRLNDV
jgi:hypothetical protein